MTTKTIFRITNILTLSIAFAFSAVIQATTIYSHPIPNENDVILTFGLGTQESLPSRMSILVWNLHKGANKTFASDYETLANQKDLVLSQEMYLTPQMRSVFGAFPNDFYATATSFLFGKILTRTGVDTSSSVQPKSIEFVRTEILEPVINSPKVTLITRYPIRHSNKMLTVVNIHGINFVEGPSYKKEMDRIYEALKDIPSPLIFAGDFNSWNDDRFNILNELSQKLKLNEAKFYPDFRLTFNKHPLDHFFYTDDIKIVSAKVEEFYQGSDHKPLELEIEYSPRVFLTK